MSVCGRYPLQQKDVRREQATALLVVEMVEDGPAARAGVQVGDVLIELDEMVCLFDAFQ